MKNITVRQYFDLEERLNYDVLLKAMNPVNSFANRTIDISSKSYKDVRLMFKYAKSYKTIKELFITSFRVTEEEFYNENITTFFSAQNYLFNLLLKTQKRESDLLQSIGSDVSLWQRSGGDNLNKFSDITPLVQLGEIYSIYPFDLQEKMYNEILILLTLHKTKSEVMNEYNKLLHKQ